MTVRYIDLHNLSHTISDAIKRKRVRINVYLTNQATRFSIVRFKEQTSYDFERQRYLHVGTYIPHKPTHVELYIELLRICKQEAIQVKK